MMTLGKVTRMIKKARRKGVSYEALSNQLGVTKPTVSRIEKGHYPSRENAERLGLPAICHTCKRKIPKVKAASVRAAKIGRDENWIEYWMRKVKR